MEPKKKVLAISGSTRQRSTNLSLLKAIFNLYDSEIDFVLFDGLSTLPHFNPDDVEQPPPTVVAFRNLIRDADGILICTPEYAMGVPGSLKNALDWTVSTSDFSKKPVAVITASTSGEKAHGSLIGTLNVIEASTSEEIQLLISFAKAKIDSNGNIIDEKTSKNVKTLMNNFSNLLNQARGGSK